MDDKTVKVLYWADFKKNYSKHLLRRVKEICPQYDFHIIDDVRQIGDESFDLEPYEIIVLQSTDVTKFSSDEEEREAIGDRLDDFVDDGKKLVVSHDVIYRRTRNKRLQEMYGYQITNFARESRIKYAKTSFCKQVHAFSSLPSIFYLQDGELCWGDVAQIRDKKVFFDAITVDPTTGKKITVPLVFGKIYNGGGQLVWFNTGDTFDEPPQPVTDCDENFVKLLAECLELDMQNLRDMESSGEKILPLLHSCDFNKPFTFICYSAANSARVYEICLLLNLMGVNYFLDFKNITSSAPGSDGWKDDVNRALVHPQCKSAFVFLSEDFLESDNCYYEVKQMNEFTKPFVPILLSLSLDPERILEIINSWSSLACEDKIKTMRDLLAIRKNPDTARLEVNQLVYHCHRNLSQFTNAQLLDSIARNCDTDISSADTEIMQALISECKKTIAEL